MWSTIVSWLVNNRIARLIAGGLVALVAFKTWLFNVRRNAARKAERERDLQVLKERQENMRKRRDVERRVRKDAKDDSGATALERLRDSWSRD